MTDIPLKDVIARFTNEEQTILDEMKRLDVRLAKIRHARAALTALESDEPPEFEGKLADACRAVLKANAGRSLAPMQVRDALKALGYDLSQHNNEMASIHSVLKRLADSGPVKPKPKSDGSTRYYWPAPSDPVLDVQPGAVKITGHAPTVKITGGKE
jgi:hypothetical protein